MLVRRDGNGLDGNTIHMKTLPSRTVHYVEDSTLSHTFATRHYLTYLLDMPIESGQHSEVHQQPRNSVFVVVI